LLSIIEFVVSYLLIFKTRLKERLNDWIKKCFNFF
jgi:hypothetical protein